jgi:hypothetical protein
MSRTAATNSISVARAAPRYRGLALVRDLRRPQLSPKPAFVMYDSSGSASNDPSNPFRATRMTDNHGVKYEPAGG